MTFDTTKYNPPGVYTESVPGPQLNVLSTAPDAVAIFGESIGYQTYTETLIIPADSSVPQPVALTQKGANAATLVVRNSNTSVPYVLNTDYTVTTTAGAGATLGDGNDVVTVKRVAIGGLAALTPVQVSYQFTDPTYYNLYTFFDFDNLRDHYGPAFNTAGTLTSPLTLAASLAFLNGAQSIVTVSTTGATTQNYIDALTKLENAPSVAVIATTSGSSAVITAVSNHVINQSNNRHERRAILGTDGTSTAVSSSAKITIAQGLVNKRVALVSPSVVKYYNSDLSSYILLGGQYVAAAVAGLSVSLNRSEPLTRKQILGFVGLTENVAEQQKSIETQGGLMVLEQVGASTSNIRIRHGVTTSTATIFTKEWSIPGQEDALSFRIRDSLDAGGLLGSVIRDTTLITVKAATDAALDSLVTSDTIIAYSDLKVRQLPTSPDKVEVRFGWQPAIPLNYVLVKFSINVVDGTITPVAA